MKLTLEVPNKGKYEMIPLMKEMIEFLLRNWDEKETKQIKGSCQLGDYDIERT